MLIHCLSDHSGTSENSRRETTASRALFTVMIRLKGHETMVESVDKLLVAMMFDPELTEMDYQWRKKLEPKHENSVKAPSVKSTSALKPAPLEDSQDLSS